MTEELEENNKEQTSSLDFDFSNNICENNLAKDMESIKTNKSDSKTNNNLNISEYQKYIIINANTINSKISNESIIIKGNSHIIYNNYTEENKTPNFRVLYENLCRKYIDVLKENERLKRELDKYKNKKNNKNNFSNIKENKKLELTKINSYDSIPLFFSSIINKEEINELNDAKYKAYISTINKNNINKKISEKFDLLEIKKSKIKTEVNYSGEKDKKFEKEKREIYIKMNKSRNIIKEFKKKYNIRKYSNYIIFYCLEENNFDEAKAYDFLKDKF